MNFFLFDHPHLRSALLPFTFTRPVAGIRVGILTLAEKWSRHLGAEAFYLTLDYLVPKFGTAAAAAGAGCYINGAVCPQPDLVAEIRELHPGQALYQADLLVAYCHDQPTFDSVEELMTAASKATERKELRAEVAVVRHLWDIFRLNGDQIRADFDLLTRGRQSQPLTDPHTRVYSPGQIFIEEGVKIRAAILNAEQGPIYLGRDSEVHEGAIIRGPFALGEGSHVNPGAKMRGDITIGPFCKVGGEISNSVLFAYSNKGHDGFLGNAVVGEWCNLGADTNNSNLKNNYATVKLWSHVENRYHDTGLQFCGLMMGDHSKCGINTMFNTGTVVGVNANIFGAGFPPTFVPSFSWGGSGGNETYQLPKALEVAERTMARRQLPLTQADRDLLTRVFHDTQKDRDQF